ncbi:hypothetical protein [Pedobacter sp. SYSU D00535]|uniref:hypothetical protein n=1 Tax=Pedobacter sp. SYSU D00535 TaxID=2810308 RepID=UPI001A96366F|nr:hypothetical protein [Pedobacter sp. SYSU D00535]
MLGLLTFIPKQDDKFLFFAQQNPLDQKPIVLLPSGEYIHVYQKQVPIALFRLLYQHFLSKPNLVEKLRQHRNMSLERKTEDVFKQFFRKESRTFFYTNYHSNPNTEQDLLILSKNAAFIIEIKASKYRQPFRDPVKGFTRLKSDFKESIQYGYDQCLRIEDKVFENTPFTVFDKATRPYILSIQVGFMKFILLLSHLNALDQSNQILI